MVAVRLNLPPTMNIVNSFHVSRLKKENSSEFFTHRSTVTRPDPVIVNKNDSSLNEWEVEEIIGKRVNHRRVEYLVKWKDCESEENSWEPVSNLTNSTESVRQFERREIENRKRHDNNTMNSIKVTHTTKPTVKPSYAEVLTTIQKKQPTLRPITVQPQVKINSIRILTTITPVSNDRRREQSLQCSARINKGRGRRCRNKTRRSDMCQPHLQSAKNLHIKQSNIATAGLGLFTGGKTVERGAVITPYTGEVSKTAVNGNYVLKCTKSHFVNANRTVDVGGYANDCRRVNRERGECEGNNSKLAYDRRTKQANVVALKELLPRTEVCANYGSDYWSKFNRDGLKKKTE
jgi:Chromo (CHRromatin Organisation MOdifier) domain